MFDIRIPSSLQPYLQITILSLSLLFLLASPQTASAQNIQPRPVARLITSPSNVASFSRPRRVNVAAESAGAAASNTAGVLLVSPSLDDASTIERRAFELTNHVRERNGLAALAWDPDLCLMARAHSRSMGSLQFFSHETPEGMSLRNRARANGILHFRVLGENIAYNQGYDDPGAFAVERWMISQGHRGNILSQEFQASALGSFVAPDGRVYITQVFITR
jgi:uncharacterized protein YkwD